MKSNIEVYAERANSRFGILTVSPINFQQWKEEALGEVNDARVIQFRPRRG